MFKSRQESSTFPPPLLFLPLLLSSSASFRLFCCFSSRIRQSHIQPPMSCSLERCRTWDGEMVEFQTVVISGKNRQPIQEDLCSLLQQLPRCFSWAGILRPASYSVLPFPTQIQFISTVVTGIKGKSDCFCVFASMRAKPRALKLAYTFWVQ